MGGGRARTGGWRMGRTARVGERRAVGVTRRAWPVLAVSLAVVAGCEAPASGAALEPTPPQSGYVRSGADSLHYAIDLPVGTEPAPAFVLVHGSGRQTKEYNRVLSEPLLRAGFVVLRYDKRGTGLSSGQYTGVGIGNSPTVIPQLASDALAAVEVLRAHPRVDPERIGLVGVSQAGWIVPEAMSRSDVLSWSVLWVGPTVSVGEEIYYSRLADGTDVPFDELSDSLAAYTGPRGYDPRPVLAAVDAPGLWLLGAADRSIPTRESEQILSDLAASGRPFDWITYPGVGHCLSCGDLPLSADTNAWLRERGILP